MFVNLAGNYMEADIVSVPIIDVLSIRPEYLPQTVPEDLYDYLMQLHGAPFVWFAGQLMAYLMRLNDETRKHVDDAMKRLGFVGQPIVGIHIRRLVFHVYLCAYFKAFVFDFCIISRFIYA